MCLIWQILKQTQGRWAVAKCLYLSWSAIHAFSSYPTFAVQHLLVRKKPDSGDVADLQMGGLQLRDSTGL